MKIKLEATPPSIIILTTDRPHAIWELSTISTLEVFMKKIVLLIALFFSFSVYGNAYSQVYPQNIDGSWLGKITMAKGIITYNLYLDVHTKKNGDMVATARTENGKLVVRKIELEASDVHSPLWLTVELIKTMKDANSRRKPSYFRIILTADVTQENVLKGHAEQFYNDHPEGGRAYGTFMLRKINPKKWY